MKPFLFSHSDDNQVLGRDLTPAEMNLVSGADDMETVGPEHEDTLRSTKNPDGTFSSDGTVEDTRP